MICPNCNNPIDDASKFCMNCGASIPQNGNQYNADGGIPPYTNNFNVAPPKKNTKKIAGIIIAALSALILVAVLITVCVKTEFFGIAGETVTDAQGNKVHSGMGTDEISVMDVDGTVRQIKTDRSLVTKEDILKEYTDVLNKLKDKSPAFTYLRYQNLPTENQNIGSVAKIVLPIIEKYVTSQSAALPVNYPAGNADKLPVVNSPYGCLLTDTEKIKNAYTEILESGDYKIVITLNDEADPEILPSGAASTQSGISAIFDPYDAAKQISAIAELALSDISFNYTDCTATLVYDKKSKDVVSLDLTMNIDVTANAYITTLQARIVDVVSYSSFVY